MTIDEMIEILQAKKEGKKIGCNVKNWKESDSEWLVLEGNSNHFNFAKYVYRIESEDTKKPILRYIDILKSEHGLFAGSLNLTGWLDEPNFVGFKHPDGKIWPYPVRVCDATAIFYDNPKFNIVSRATHVVVEE